MQFSLANRQRKFRFSLPLLRSLCAKAFPLCLEISGEEPALLPTLKGVQFSIISDTAIARVHDEFFLDPSPTDVITFPYGEVLLGAGTITANALAHNHAPDREAALCIIHAMLHLNGFTDLQDTGRTAMHRRQDEILQEIYPLPAAEKTS